MPPRVHVRPLLHAVVVACALALPGGPTAQAAGPSAVSLSGTFHAVIVDDFRSRSETRFSLETATGTIPLAVPAGVAVPREGARVRVAGVRGGGPAVTVTSVQTMSPAVPTASSSFKPPTAPGRSILVIVADFTDMPGDPVTPAQATATFTGAASSVHAFYAAASRGRVATTATIAGPWSLGIAATCDPNAVWSAGDAIATAHGIDPAAFDHVVVWTATPACAWWAGVGQIGWSHVWVSESWPTWGDPTAMMSAVASHEIGHNLGLLHASSYPCWDPQGNQVTSGGTCAAVEYGDPFSNMGDSYTYWPLFDSGELDDLGWLDPGEAADVTAVGTYSLVPTYSAAPGVRLLRVPRAPLFDGPDSGSWWLEIRGAQAGSFDRFGSPPGPVSAGVTVRFRDGPGWWNSYLLDATPTGTGHAGATFNDAPFVPGQTFADPAGGLTIRVETAGPSGATVTIGDTEPPSAPGALATTGGAGGVQLDWGAAADNLGLASYVVRRDGTVIATVPALTLSYLDAAVAPGSAHAYDVWAVDTAGLDGAAVSAAGLAPTLPGAPGAVTALPGDGAAVVSWSAADDGGSPITGYTATSDPDGKSCATTGARSCTVGGLANGTAYSFTVVAANGMGPGPASSPSDPVTPRAAPSAAMKPLPTWIATTVIPLAWSGTAGSAAVTSFEVRYRRAAWNGPFGAYTTWSTAATQASFTASHGSTYCFSVRAMDATDVLSPWTAETCTAIPLDDRSLTRSRGWTRGTGTAYFRSTYVRSSSSGARLVRAGVRARRIAIVATTCRTCGSVRVYWGATLLRTVNLASATTVNRRLIVVTTFASARSGTLTIRVSSSGRKVIIDGVAIRAL